MLAPPLKLTQHNSCNIKRPHFVKCGERGDVTAPRSPDRKFGEWIRNAIFNGTDPYTNIYLYNQ